MSTKTKTKGTTTKKENLAALALPALWERFKEATGESTKSPNKKFLLNRIEAALAARASEPELEQATPSPAKRNARASEPAAETREPDHGQRAVEAAGAVRGDDHRGTADEVPGCRRAQHGQR